MKVTTTSNGLGVIAHKMYGSSSSTSLVQCSSIEHKKDNLGIPGSSALWIGADHELNRNQVKQLVSHLQHWLEHGTLN